MTRFILALALALAVLSTSSPGLAASGPEELGLELVPYARKIGERRYQSQRDYDATLKFFKDKFKNTRAVRFFREVSLPAVKYTHFESTNDKTAWEGVNVYQLKNGEVRVYVLPRTVKTASALPASTAPASTTKP